MTCPGCQHENRASAKFCEECGTPFQRPEGSAQPAPSYADWQRVATEAQEQQAATAEILSVISRAPTEIDPVLAAVVQNASRLCSAAHVSLFRVEGAVMRKVAEQGPQLTSLGVGDTRPISRRSVSGRAIVDRTTIHVSDHQSEQAAREYPEARRDTGIRTTIGIPLLREGVAIGAFTAYRTESRPFSPREIALLQTFADQAVIAIENVRLFTELEDKNRALTMAHAQVSESLEQQTATSEILRVISSSPTDIAPVFDAIAQSAVRLWDGDYCNVASYEGEQLHMVGHANVTGEGVELFELTKQMFPMRPNRATVLGRSVLQRTVVHLPDLRADAEYSPSLAETGGSAIGVPILREGEPIGSIAVGRSRAWPFVATQIKLLQTFADQAVIAVDVGPCPSHRGAGAADSDQRDPKCHFEFANRASAGL